MRLMWKNFVEQDGPQLRRMRIACWIPKARKTHPECVIPIAFPLQQWLHVRASMLRYKYIVYLVLLRFPVVLNDNIHGRVSKRP